MKTKRTNSSHKAPMVPMLGADALAERVNDELQEIMNHLSVDNAKFARAAATILADIFNREMNGQISEVRSLELINAFIITCVESEDAHRVTRDSIEILRNKIAATRMRKGKSKRKDERIAIIKELSRQWREQHPKKQSNRQTERGISTEFKTRCEARGLKPLKPETIRRLIPTV